MRYSFMTAFRLQPERTTEVHVVDCFLRVTNKVISKQKLSSFISLFAKKTKWSHDNPFDDPSEVDGVREAIVRNRSEDNIGSS